MRLPIRVAEVVRARRLIAPGQRVLVALSGGPDSVALLHCLIELSRKRDLAFELAAAHLNHGLRGKSASADDAFCQRLAKRTGIELIRAFVDTPHLSQMLKRSREESARIARHAFLLEAARICGAGCVAVAHHADDRIETVLFRLCRGSGLAGLQGIGWTGPLHLQGEPDVRDQLQWPEPRCEQTMSADVTSVQVIRPLLGCTRKEVLEYLRSKRQRFCTDETNFDVKIPRNALRNLAIPLLEEKVHPGARAALWRLAEEAETHAADRVVQRQWFAALIRAAQSRELVLPAVRDSLPDAGEISDLLEGLRLSWNLSAVNFSLRHVQSIRALFDYTSGPKRLNLPGGLSVERRGKEVSITREAT